MSISIVAGAVPRPEHPTPQVRRAEWANLNGTWEFAEANEQADEKYLKEDAYPDKIVVPFPREAKLSGLGRTGYITNVYYRRSFDKPDGWKSSRVLLHFGASDWRTTVWVNGQELGRHTGGSTPFAFDITKVIKPKGNIVIVHAFDDLRSGSQAGGKQAWDKSEGCSYTRTTGIWQTVWLEGVGTSYIRDFRIDTDPASSRILIRPEIDGPSTGLTVKAVAYAAGKMVGSVEGPADWRNTGLVLNLKTKRLWSIQDPFLYDLRIVLRKGGKTVDSVDSYFGLRSVSIEGTRILINGKPVFQRLILDQGFYPDGIWTAPTDAALKRDILLSQALGFNGARFHQKVFDPRSLYWADKLGYLVWGEYPNWLLNCKDLRGSLAVVNEWVEVVRRDRNHPSIIGWCPFNETQDDAHQLQNLVFDSTRTMDPSRPIIDTSGWSHSTPYPEVSDDHDYNQRAESFRGRWSSFTKLGANGQPIPFMVSEYGGIALADSGGWGYGRSPKDLEEFYTRYKGLTDALMDNPNMFGFTYTQLTDVEQERNGLYTYDRKPKFDAGRIRKINSRAAAYEKRK